MEQQIEGADTRAAIYTRISKDLTVEGLGVTRQLKDCRAMAKRNGWQVVSEFPDVRTKYFCISAQDKVLIQNARTDTEPSATRKSLNVGTPYLVTLTDGTEQHAACHLGPGRRQFPATPIGMAPAAYPVSGFGEPGLEIAATVRPPGCSAKQHQEHGT